MEEETTETQSSAQMKIIRELQKTVQELQKLQSQLIVHITSLEDTVIALSDSKDDSIIYRKAQKMAKKIKRKRQEKKTYYTDDSETSKESNEQRRAPRFRKQPRGNTLQYYSVPQTNSPNRKYDKNDLEETSKTNESND